MGDHKIKLISFGYFEAEIHKKVALAVQKIFDLPVELSVQHLDLNSFFDSQRKQYNGNLLLKHIETNFTSNLTKTIGLFSIDLFIPILTYIFGQAYLGGNSGIASIYRLGNERY
ncbi:MAG: hypothetical protein Q8T08_21630, partial [Ignavibacteria bacterium]|nr:hypothetical protein [Ignavibacteria bacterium]